METLKEKDQKIKRESTIANKVASVTFFSWFIEELASLDCADDEFI